MWQYDDVLHALSARTSIIRTSAFSIENIGMFSIRTLYRS
ncbi:hypothetical protein SEVCU037_0565 [Staphylococcus epidermidis VCU037]|nr:hypothetical protein SEVCU037_0565 [Staphylococcus epidermidis VCU037]